MPSNEVYCSHSKRLAPTHLVTNLIDFQATTSFEVLQAMRRVISLTYQPWPGTLESELEAPHFCRGRRQRHESCHTGKPDFRVSNWAPRKARTQPNANSMVGYYWKIKLILFGFQAIDSQFSEIAILGFNGPSFGFDFQWIGLDHQLETPTEKWSDWAGRSLRHWLGSMLSV